MFVYSCVCYFHDVGNRMKNKTKYHTVGSVSKSNQKILGRGKIDTSIYMSAHFHDLEEELQ